VERKKRKMKTFLTAIFIGVCHIAMAQTTKIIRGDAPPSQTGGIDIKKIINGVTDTNVYDMDGNIIDSVTVGKMLRTYDYYAAFSIPKGQTSLKRVIEKADPEKDAETERYFKMTNRPKSDKLWYGITLDLKPLEQRTDVSKLEGKGVVLIFWKSARAHHYFEGINNVIADNIGDKKFEVFAITGQSYNDAKRSLQINPILNAHQIVDAEKIVDDYGVTESFVLVVTNAQHQVTYAITTFAAITPRVLKRLFKEL
jgi:hypothetical protein